MKNKDMKIILQEWKEENCEKGAKKLLIVLLTILIMNNSIISSFCYATDVPYLEKRARKWTF